MATIDGLTGTSQATVVPVPVASVVLTPATAQLQRGGAVQLTATPLDARGAALTGRTVTWSTTNAAIATVTASGMVTGVAAGGPVGIVATSEGQSASAQVTVVAPPPSASVATVTVTPATVSLAVGSALQLSATLRDSAGNVLTGRSVTWSSANNAVATVSTAGLVTAISAGGPIAITATSEGRVGTATTTVTPVVNVPATITINSSLQYQTMTGWEALAEIGQSECDPRAYQSYKNGVLDRAANELGINRIRIALRNGYENPVDYFSNFLAGQLTFNQWKVFWFQVVNDNSDPFVMNPAGFNWGYLDYTIDELVVPLKQRLAARGEGFWLNLEYVGANSGDLHRDSPDEYAELALAAFQHLQQRYGWVPNSLEIVNEPNLGTWNGTQVGQALVAAKARLNAAGFFPQFVGPTVSQVTPSFSLLRPDDARPGCRAGAQRVQLPSLQLQAYRQPSCATSRNAPRSTGSARRCSSTAGAATRTCTRTSPSPTSRRGSSSGSPSAAIATSAGTTSPSTAPRSGTTPPTSAPGR